MVTSAVKLKKTKLGGPVFKRGFSHRHIHLLTEEEALELVM